MMSLEKARAPAGVRAIHPAGFRCSFPIQCGPGASGVVLHLPGSGLAKPQHRIRLMRLPSNALTLGLPYTSACRREDGGLNSPITRLRHQPGVHVIKHEQHGGRNWGPGPQVGPGAPVVSVGLWGSCQWLVGIAVASGPAGAATNGAGDEEPAGDTVVDGIVAAWAQSSHQPMGGTMDLAESLAGPSLETNLRGRRRAARLKGSEESLTSGGNGSRHAATLGSEVPLSTVEVASSVRTRRQGGEEVEVVGSVEGSSLSTQRATGSSRLEGERRRKGAGEEAMSAEETKRTGESPAKQKRRTSRVSAVLSVQSLPEAAPVGESPGNLDPATVASHPWTPESYDESGYFSDEPMYSKEYSSTGGPEFFGAIAPPGGPSSGEATAPLASTEGNLLQPDEGPTAEVERTSESLTSGLPGWDTLSKLIAEVRHDSTEGGSLLAYQGPLPQKVVEFVGSGGEGLVSGEGDDSAPGGLRISAETLSSEGPSTSEGMLTLRLVPARLRRSLLEALRRARAQHTDSGAMRVLDEWWEQAPRSNVSTEALLSAVMELEEKEERKTLRQLLDWMVHAGRVRIQSTAAFNVLLRAAGAAVADMAHPSARGLRRVDAIFQEMRHRSIPPNEETFKILISVYAASGQHERAVAVHKLMVDSGAQPTKNILQMLLKAYCASKDIELAEQVLWDIASAAGGLSVEDLNLFLFTLSREGRACDIIRLLQTILNARAGESSTAGAPYKGIVAGLPTPNSASLRALLRCFAALGQPSRAAEVMELLKTHRITPDAKLLTELVSAFGIAGSPTEAESTLLWAYGTGLISLQPAPAAKGVSGRARNLWSRATEQWVPLYTSLVFAYARQHLWAEGLDVISEMKRAIPSFSDERPFNVLMGEMASAGEAQRASALLGVMESSGVTPKASSFRTLARAFCAAKQPEKAEDVLLEMESQGWKVSEEAVVALLNAYALCRRPSEVERVVENLDAFGLRKTPGIYSVLVGSFCLLALPRAAEAVFSEAFPIGVRRPTALACAWLISAHLSLGDQEAAGGLVALLSAQGLALGAKELKHIADALTAVGKQKEADMFVQYAVDAGLVARGAGEMRNPVPAG